MPLNLKSSIILIMSFMLFAVLSVIFRGGNHFYESGVYTAYAESMIQDGDFNIVNQMPPESSWVVTPTLHHPDGHPLTQTPFIFTLHLFESLADKLTGKKITPEFQYLFSSLTINFSLFFLIFYFLNSLNQHFFKHSNISVILFFLFGSTFFYFNFFVTNVTDTFSIPLLSYCLLKYHQFKDDSPDIKELLFFGLALGILSSLKLLYIPLSIFWFLSLTFQGVKNEYFKNKLLFLISSLLAPLILSINTYIKFGSFYLESSYVARVLFDYSFSHLFSKFFIGYLGVNGFFFLNPMLFLGLIAFLFLGWKIFTKKIEIHSLSKIDYLAYFIFLGIIFFHPIFVMGNMVEDLLPGRATLIAAPFLTLSLTIAFTKLPIRRLYTRLTLFFLGMWNFFVIINFVIIDSKDALLYYQKKFLFQFSDQTILRHYFDLVEDRLLSLAQLLPSLLVYSLFVIVILNSAKKVLKNHFKFQSLFVFWIITFFAFSLLNSFKSEENVLALKKKNYFYDKVIGNGLDLYMYDYILDRFNTVNVHSNNKLEEELNKRAKIYYSVIDKQIIQSTHQFDKRRKTKAWKNITMH